MSFLSELCRPRLRNNLEHCYLHWLSEKDTAGHLINRRTEDRVLGDDVHITEVTLQGIMGPNRVGPGRMIHVNVVHAVDVDRVLLVAGDEL